jgi:PPM family protein phosphatase
MKMPLVPPRDWPPTSSMAYVELGAHSRRGPHRRVNTDHYLVAQLDRRFQTLMSSCSADDLPGTYDEHGYGLVVADGLGSGAEGEIASRLAISSLAHLAVYFGKWNLRTDPMITKEVMNRVERFFRYVDVMLVDASREPGSEPLNSALSAAVSAGDQLFIAHVGHSRTYLLRDKSLVQLTRDHTIPYGSGMLDRSAPRDASHVLGRTLGAQQGCPEVDVHSILLADGDVVLLCTNGLTDVLPEKAIERVLGGIGLLDDKCRQLVDEAFDAGASDDVTALLARYHIPEAGRAEP